MKKPDLLRGSLWPRLAGLVLIMTSFSLAGPVQAQQCTEMAGSGILSITEVEQNGKLHTNVLQNQPAIVDINSSLRIIIDKDSLRSRTAAWMDSTILQEQIAKALVLQQAASKGLEGMPLLQEQLAAWADDPDHRDLKALREALQAVGESALDIVEIAESDPAFLDKLDAILEARAEQGIEAQYQAVMEAGAAEAARLRSRVDDLLNRQGIYYQMGAWIVTQRGTLPLHLPGFDDYPVGDTTEIERFNIQITSNQIAQLQELTANARELNTGGISAVFNTLKSSAPAFFSGIIGRAERTNATLENALDEIDTEVDLVRQTVQQTKTDASNYFDLLRGLKQKYLDDDFGDTFGSLDGFLSTINQDWDHLKNQTNGLVTQIDTLRNLPKRFRPGSPLHTTLTNVVGVFEPIRNTLDGDISGTVGKLSEILGGFGRLKDINTEALAFGQEVLKLDITTLPHQTEVSLLTSGVRSPGDGIVIKIATGRKNELPCDLETPQIQLYRVSSFLKTVGGLIYARSISKDRPFEFGPAYNVLFSWGSRTSPSINTLWTPGIGLNLSALDFNNNESPELGLSLVFSLLRDYIQFGGGVNVQEEEFFGFFGLSLPLPSSTIPFGN